MPRRLMQVGLGDFGQRWLRVANDHPNWTYAALATRNDEVREKCGREAKVPEGARFRSIEEALGSGIEADAVLVTTPHFRHLHDVTTALGHGVPVLVEKPLAGNWSQCLAIWRAARDAGGAVMVAENYRFGEGARIMRDLVQGGEVGEPEFVRMDFFAGHVFPEGDWRNEYHYPLLVENATHQFDLVRYVLARDAEQVFCNAAGSSRTPQWPWPTVSAQFLMSGGLPFQFAGSWAYEELGTPWEGEWRLHGSTGSIRWTRDLIEVHRAGGKRTIAVSSKPSDHTIAATFAEFDSALAEGRKPVPDIEDNMQTLAMVFGAIRSHETRASVSMDTLLAEGDAPLAS